LCGCGQDGTGSGSCSVANSDIHLLSWLKGAVSRDSNPHYHVLQISSMVQRLDCWCKDVNSMELLLETKAHEFLTLWSITCRGVKADSYLIPKNTFVKHI